MVARNKLMQTSWSTVLSFPIFSAASFFPFPAATRRSPVMRNSLERIKRIGNNVHFSNSPKAKRLTNIPSVRTLSARASINFPTLTATGYAVVSTQPGQNVEQKRLMAIRAARMSAMRELAEQIHGLKVDSNTTVIDLMVQNDTFRGIVSGIIRGARTVRINPTGSDTYETVLEIDQDMVAYLFRQAQTL